MVENKQSHHSILRKIAHRAMLEHGLLPDFSETVLGELNQLQLPVQRGGKTIRDLRMLPWCSIDHNDSHSLDQLTYAESLAGGKSKILIAIADVEVVVKKLSAIDSHARHNTCSVYTEAELFPMLPQKLSTDISSLSQGEDRLALICEIIVNGDGTIKSFDIYQAWVKNWAKLKYGSLGLWLEGKEEMPQAIATVNGLEANLRLQERVATLMNANRQEHGALDYETCQLRAVFENGEVKELDSETPNPARCIVTDFMIATNGVVASYLRSRSFPSFRRVVLVPKRWDRIVELAAEQGSKLPNEPNVTALNQFLKTEKASDPTHFPYLSLSISKLLGPGAYTIELPGISSGEHFGLAVKDYTHSTAPNRRYPDLITQRLLKAALAGQPVPYQTRELEELAMHCTAMEDVVKKVERQVSKSVAAMHLQSHIGEQYNAIVTGASKKGTWVRTLHPPVEGKLVNGFEGLDVGHKLRVQLLRANVEKGFIDFSKV